MMLYKSVQKIMENLKVQIKFILFYDKISYKEFDRYL